MITREQAREQFLPGWNLRCNRCGSYGAEWMGKAVTGRDLRPGFGAYAACPEHKAEIHAEVLRHEKAMLELTAVHFEQDRRPA